MMTEEEKKKLLAGFVKAEPKPEEEPEEDPQREEKLLATAHRIAERLGLTETFADKLP